MEQFSLSNKTAIVTGGNRGLGRSMALVLAKAGADVVVIGRDKGRNQEVIQEIKSLGRKGLGLSTDLRDIHSITDMVDEVVDTFGKIDILINNAGVSTTGFALDITEDEWDMIMELNVKSLFFCSQAVAKKMKEQESGKIINISSVMGEVGDVGISPYTASKGAVNNLTRALSLEWARFGIQVNAVGPAYVETEMNQDKLSDPKILNKITSKTPMRRLGKADELEGAILLLASDASSFMTGQVIYVDGGWLAQ